jgi:hypothetical protein
MTFREGDQAMVILCQCEEIVNNNTLARLSWNLYNFFQMFQETYNTYVEYTCVNGSQFDTNKDGKGDTIAVQIRCLWNKTWSPWPVLPPCVITHCVNPFPIPANSNLIVREFFSI